MGSIVKLDSPINTDFYGDSPIFDYTGDHIFWNSSALAHAWYNDKSRALVVEFHTGNYAGYKDVNLDTWKGLVSADSAGQFYAYNVKNIFPGFTTPNDLRFNDVAISKATLEEFDAQDDEKSQSWTVTADVSAPVTLNVDGATLEEALANFKREVESRMKDNSVNFTFRSITQA